ncbi:MAG TPA: efflux RND transporter periplasmic adaptor subunit [Rhodocyclaceae bacterium]|uniref:efflux RND transporter periplasmic adaptor subunit n=1 Tax=Zoogloea sp. TaxID=49181 RepID=UPI002CA8A6D3|nr:efflux RND transporter periplasmic adaptor subunit [Zoogloea sp.]HMV17913.1 efflux RND transporter periplasmic adaptor subunit [Rhodocyclaceae bacterium]HMW52950.1 efflux RND transporter periplasmic adaptor subunit [Rhodocyclaceae bacterium]HNA68085.1 efflux RND transporter periplasmic adaptor subunit [Rhodocyclaceae bacterium]HNB64440.1 efflux RND transporter periplasmic adaptor subunit [Rhodocyclaceae bacterium]HNE16457.1 efflux RND transporter periplasmic adaptor subunit [Rhodocyclaceae 
MNRKQIAIAAVVAIAVAAAVYLRITRVGEDTPDTPVVQKPSAEPGLLRFPTAAPQLAQLKVDAAAVSPVPMDEPLAAKVAYDENATARLFAPVAGRVIEIHGQIGDTVKAGAVLAVLDAPELGAAEADVSKADAEASRTKAAFERARSLFDAEVIARRDLESAESDWRQARAEADRARLRLANLTPGGSSVSGQRYTVRAPIGGVIAARHINPAMEVRPDAQDPLFVVTDLSRLSVLVDVPERDLPLVTVGKAAVVEASAYPNRNFDGQVVHVAPTLDPATRRVQARVSVDNREKLLKPEMYARVSLLADAREELPRIPTAALLVEGVKNFVFVERAPGEFEKREVTLAVQTRQFAYVWHGLKGGEKVVSAGALLLNAELASSSAR